MKRHGSCIPGLLLFFLLAIIGLVAVAIFVPAMAWQSFGAP